MNFGADLDKIVHCEPVSGPSKVKSSHLIPDFPFYLSRRRVDFCYFPPFPSTPPSLPIFPSHSLFAYLTHISPLFFRPTPLFPFPIQFPTPVPFYYPSSRRPLKLTEKKMGKCLKSMAAFGGH